MPRSTFFLYGFLFAVLSTPTFSLRQTNFYVTAYAETTPVNTRGDAADDPAIWLHPTDPAKSRIYGTDKRAGIATYDLSGKLLDFLPSGAINNIDLRHGFSLGGATFSLLAGSDSRNRKIRLYKIDPESGSLSELVGSSFSSGVRPYGLCMYKDLDTNTFYAITTSRYGTFVQWSLVPHKGNIVPTLVRKFALGSKTEGCVADDENNTLFVAPENRGIFRLGAKPETGDTKVQIGTTRSGGQLSADVEGLTLYKKPDGTGFLIASSQGDNRFVMYERSGNNKFVSAFKIRSPQGSLVAYTDGIAALSASMGPSFERGILVVQDGTTSDGRSTQNFKIVNFTDVLQNLP